MDDRKVNVELTKKGKTFSPKRKEKKKSNGGSKKRY
jgi:hypothetical protein